MNEKKQQSSRIGMRIMVGLLTLVMLITVCMPGLAVKANAEDTGLDDTQQAAPTLATRTVTASVNGLDFSVTGQFTETTELNVQALGSNEADYIRDSVLNLDEQIVGSAYDITLYDNGIEIQPGEDVEVSISGITAAESVYHLSHTSAADVQKLTAEKTGRKAGAVLKHEKVDFRQEQGRLKFKTNGFSVYYIASGDMSIGNKEDRGAIANRTNDTYYTMPGTTLYFYVNTNDRVNWETELPPGITGASNASYEEHPAYQITIPDGFVPAADGTSFTLTAKWGSSSGKVTITVLTAQDFVNNAVNSGNDIPYPVYVAVLRNNSTSTGTPNEPAQSGSSYSYIQKNNDGTYKDTDKTDATGYFATNGNGIINPSISSHAYFKGSVDGSNTVGLVDPTGVETKAMLKLLEKDWQGILWAVYSTRSTGNNTLYDSDGNEVPKGLSSEQLFKDYEVIPYVIKFEPTNLYEGWHIDCAVVKKARVNLTYNNNIPAGFKLDTSITLPNNVTTTAGANVKVGSISGMINGETVDVSGINTAEEYTFTFVGWNTKPDGTGKSYSPGDDLILNEDTTLYAIWNSNPAIGTGNLKITKKVIVPEGGSIPDTDFTFTLNIKDDNENGATGTYKYTVFDAATNVAIENGTGTVSNGGTISLKHNQYVIIYDLPAENDKDGEPNVTVTETDSADYDESWDGGATENLSTRVKIEGGRRSEVTCTNTPVVRTAVTITKEVKGNMGDLNKKFSFTVTDDKGTINETFSLSDGDSKKFENVPVGTILTITEVSGVYTMTANKGTVDPVNGNILTYTVGAEDVTITVTNTYNVNIDTGVLLDTIPYVLILGVVAVGAVLLLKKRRNRDDV